ncbi:type II toxin-antitoxin system HicA family toxin [Hydrogenivirga sp. 128-5-R1-1]|uniref:type II toxin-antitoxin system HicA family toxin n=1 Tax=Hydrogenivirga sp. 128-5-R1-1 TaxID=392423 RepID=UPI000A6B33EB|nr:type II toxin-antitoxin system HicA family toxin [Hydrogenivirga sp. 128-5-R1-1]
MPKIPVLKPDEVVRALKNLGFKEARQKGSHKVFKHDDGRVTVVPIHKGRDISPVLLRKILKDIGIPVDEFLEALKK